MDFVRCSPTVGSPSACDRRATFAIKPGAFIFSEVPWWRRQTLDRWFPRKQNPFQGNLLPVRTRSTLPTLDAHLGYWLRRVSNEVSGAFARGLQAEGISAAEWVALRLLHGETKRTPGDLAALTGMTRGAVSKVLDKLEAKAFVTRVRNPEDNRVQWLSLTRSGQRLVPKLAALADRNDGYFFGCLSAEEQTSLRKLLEKLTEFHRLGEVPVD